ncbi:hypothetical protein ACIHFC_36445 [Streptomyces sp. NPDC052013]|uniref:hypothetical protein n=1 Tax=Streptomyces sp. NPDC052013 TaxID=3365679 RepID=UPI0037D37838
MAFSPASWIVDAFFVPQHPDPSAAARLERCRSFRARVLWDGGRRSEFRTQGGSFTDAQALDFGAWHFNARREPAGPVLGYIRLVTPATVERYQSREFLGVDRFSAVLEASGVGVSGVFEHSRLVVDPAARGLGLGAHMHAVSMAAARTLGADAMIGITGIADGQFRLYQRFGFDIVPDTQAHVPHYNDDVCVIFNRTSDGADEYEDLVERVRTGLAFRSAPAVA